MESQKIGPCPHLPILLLLWQQLLDFMPAWRPARGVSEKLVRSYTLTPQVSEPVSRGEQDETGELAWLSDDTWRSHSGSRRPYKSGHVGLPEWLSAPSGRREKGLHWKNQVKYCPCFLRVTTGDDRESVWKHCFPSDILSLQRSPVPLPTWLPVVGKRGGGHEPRVEELPRFPLSTACSLSGHSGPGPESGPIPWRPVKINNARRGSWNLGRLTPGFSGLQPTGQHGLNKPYSDWAGASVLFRTAALEKDTIIPLTKCSGAACLGGELLTGKMTGWWAAGAQGSRSSPGVHSVAAMVLLSGCLLKNLHPNPGASGARRQCLPTHSNLIGKALYTFPPLCFLFPSHLQGTQAGRGNAFLHPPGLPLGLMGQYGDPGHWP